MGRPGSIMGGDEEDIEELQKLFSVITGFLGEIGPQIAQTISSILEAYPGDKVGKEVADFYKKLKEEGVPEDLAEKLTEKYFESINIMDKISKLIKTPK
jgi:predicted PurR-regulated permease PerM